MEETKECPKCKGEKYTSVLTNYGQQFIDQKCSVCDGEGEVDKDFYYEEEKI